jgi:hypothetical protein
MCCLLDEDLAWCLLQTAIVHIERDLEDIDAAFEKMKSDITNNTTEIDHQKRKCLSDISNMRKSLFSVTSRMDRNSWQWR